MGLHKNADDFFDADAEGFVRFRELATQLLEDQRQESDLQSLKDELAKAKSLNAEILHQLEQNRIFAQTNIEDRERVLAYRSKYAGELLDKLRKAEEVNQSLMQIIQVGGRMATGKSPTEEFREINIVGNANSSGMDYAAIDSISPTLLFHSMQACKERHFKLLYENELLLSENLKAVVAAKDTEIASLHNFQQEKEELLVKIMELESNNQEALTNRFDQAVYYEKKLAMERERMKSEKITTPQTDKQSMSKQHREQDIERVVLENGRYQSEMEYQSQHIEKLIQGYDQLYGQYRQLDQDRKLQNEMIRELCEKVSYYKRCLYKVYKKEKKKIDLTLERNCKNDEGTRRSLVHDIIVESDSHNLPSLTSHRPKEQKMDISSRQLVGSRERTADSPHRDLNALVDERRTQHSQVEAISQYQQFFGSQLQSTKRISEEHTQAGRSLSIRNCDFDVDASQETKKVTTFRPSKSCSSKAVPQTRKCAQSILMKANRQSTKNKNEKFDEI